MIVYSQKWPNMGGKFCTVLRLRLMRMLAMSHTHTSIPWIDPALGPGRLKIHWSLNRYEYSNKMTLKYYLYSYLCYFRSMNIVRYLFSKYVAFKYIYSDIRLVHIVASKYIRIFVCVHFMILAPHWIHSLIHTFNFRSFPKSNSESNSLNISSSKCRCF